MKKARSLLLKGNRKRYLPKALNKYLLWAKIVNWGGDSYLDLYFGRKLDVPEDCVRYVVKIDEKEATFSAREKLEGFDLDYISHADYETKTED